MTRFLAAVSFVATAVLNADASEIMALSHDQRAIRQELLQTGRKVRVEQILSDHGELHALALIGLGRIGLPGPERYFELQPRSGELFWLEIADDSVADVLSEIDARVQRGFRPLPCVQEFRKLLEPARDNRTRWRDLEGRLRRFSKALDDLRDRLLTDPELLNARERERLDELVRWRDEFSLIIQTTSIGEVRFVKHGWSRFLFIAYSGDRWRRCAEMRSVEAIRPAFTTRMEIWTL